MKKMRERDECLGNKGKKNKRCNASMWRLQGNRKRRVRRKS